MQLDDPAGDREAEAGPTGCGRTALVGPGEAFEDAVCVLGGDAGTRVGDRHRDDAVHARGRDRDRVLTRAVAQRVVDEVGDDLPEPVGVHRDRGRVVGDLDADARCGDGTGGVRDVDDQPPQVHVAPVERAGTGVELRQVQQVVDQVPEPADLCLHPTQLARVGGRDPVDQVLDLRRERGKWGPQFVADVGDQLTPHTVGVGDLDGHAVEGPGQLPHLVVARVVDGVDGVAVRQPVGLPGHLPQRRGQPAAEQVDRDEARSQGHECRDPGRQAQLLAPEQHDDRQQHGATEQRAQLQLDRTQSGDRVPAHDDVPAA